MADYNDIKQSIATNNSREITALRLNTSVVTVIKHEIKK